VNRVSSKVVERGRASEEKQEDERGRVKKKERGEPEKIRIAEGRLLASTIKKQKKGDNEGQVGGGLGRWGTW